MKQSIYKTINENINSSGQLPPDFELSREPVAPNEIRFMVGAKDGVGVFHMGPNEPKKVVKSILKHLKAGQYDKISALAKEHGVLQIIDPLLNAIETDKKINFSILCEYAKSLAFENADEEMVKLGIALLGLFDWNDSPEMQEKIITLALYEEFTLYALVVACSWEKGNDAIFKIAQSVTGWGKIHAVERLKPETKEIQEWILRNGCENEVMNSYLGLKCALKGNLIEVLRSETLDDDLYDSTGIIMDAMLDEGPVDGISVYEHAEEALRLYLQHSQNQATTITHLWNILNISSAIEDNDFSFKDELQKLCDEISSRTSWRNLIFEIVSNHDDNQFFFATNVAHRLGIDVNEQLFNAITKNPTKHCGCIVSLMKNEIYVPKIVELYQKVLPLDEMASGMNDYLFPPTLNQEYQCLDFILQQELGKYPLLGDKLVLTALRSPVTRNRNFACRVLEAWSNALEKHISDYSVTLYEALEDVAAQEVNADTKKMMMKLLK